MVLAAQARVLVVALVVALFLAFGTVACGPSSTERSGSSGYSAPEREPDLDSESGRAGSESPDGEVEIESVSIVTASNAGGQVDLEPVVLGDGGGVDAVAMDGFVSGLGRGLGREVRNEARDVAVEDGSRLMGAVVAIGCDEATGVALVREDGELAVRPQVPKSGNQCLVPMTSVALFVVPGQNGQAGGV